MAGGFGPRSFGSGRGGSSRRGSGVGRGGRRNSPGAAAKPKGQISSGKAVQYSIKGPKGGTKYIGTTNNPRRRAAEHRETGKLGPKDKLVVETRAVLRSFAEKVEAAKLSHYRNRHGTNPKHNTANDGRFHQ